jgi:nucleotide-binding universal stress UspA family protein
MSRIQRILCPVDFSPTSDRAAVYAVGLAHQLGASVRFFHAWEIPPSYPLPEGALMFGADVMGMIETESKKRMDACVGQHRDAGVPVEGIVVEGYAADRIVQAATGGAVDLVVMGTHGRRGFAHALLGSVAERVVRTSPVPVLTVPMARS